jgi:tripartite-type tricarboxylate transporter receptor subunit TctC
MRKAHRLGVTLAALLTLSAVALAQTYPVKPVRVVVPYTAGGSMDILSRLISQKMNEAFDQTLIIDNRTGAGGNIGTELVARAAPDGYTLLTAGIGIMAINPSLYSKLPYDPIKDFEAITLLAKMPNMLAVSPALPVKSVSELIALAKAKPGVLNYGSAGSGSNPHILAEYFKLRTNTDIQNIPYKGVPPALSDLIAGQLSMVFATVPTVLPQAKAGRIRALAVTSAKRLALVPELPTIAEAGVPDYEATQWIGMLAPAGTPNDIVAQLNARIVKTLQRADVRERLGTEMVEPVGSTPDEFRAFMKAEIARWAPVVKASGMKPD